MSAEFSQLEVIYLGGTFASIGTPLAPMDASALGDVLTQALKQIAIRSKIGTAAPQFNISSPFEICDSSQLSATNFLQVEQALRQQSTSPCLIITGTDTLSFFSSYIALSRCHPNCCIIASMDTLTNPISNKLRLESFAFKSLVAALPKLNSKAGVSCIVDGMDLDPLNLSKLHSRLPKAFADGWGHGDGGAQEVDASIVGIFNQQTNSDSSGPPDIAVCFATPSHEQLTNQLKKLAHEPPDALLLVGYGAGNFVRSEQIEQLLATLSLHSLIMVSTQVNFGGCSSDYAAGSWLSEFAVLSGSLNYPASYAALLYACTRSAALSDRKKTLETITG